MKNKNPFEIFKSNTTTIKIEAMGGAEVTIKTTLTVSEQLTIDQLSFANMGVNKDGRTYFNPADQARARTQAVSFLLVEPKMSMIDLHKLEGAEKALVEIYEKYLDQRDDSSGK